MPAPATYDAIVIGAGAAGLFCAATAGQRGRKVLLIDHAAQPGAKILISGGGRCNFTNVGATAANFLSVNPHFAKSALGRYTPADFIALVEAHGIAWHEKTLGQLFCDGSARQIVAMLMDECERGGVTFAFGAATDVEHRDGLFLAANASAPRLTSSTCLDFSMTARAAVMGFLTVETPATLPALSVLPSMIEASSSLRPS